MPLHMGQNGKQGPTQTQLNIINKYTGNKALYHEDDVSLTCGEKSVKTLFV